MASASEDADPNRSSGQVVGGLPSFTSSDSLNFFMAATASR
jgi:hypothetical protein